MQKRSQSTRQELVYAAVQLIANGRFADAGLVNICNTAGVSRGALYHHFTSIAELLAEVYAQAEKRVLALADDSFASRGAGAPARFGIALGKALAEDQLVRAGVRLAADGTDSPPRLREELLARLREEVLGDAPVTPEREVLADLAVVVTAGLISLGYTDTTWWGPESTQRIWDALLPLFTDAERR
ncbi:MULTISPECIES: TetR/AcrR family transcriptional regulator [Streptomyces]|uniref:TetR family transcriptional regulator n=2 Tax=Streptomyces TaxID=1883 RepID=A0A2U9P008_STRAS|nr:TetR/AcrR family transcriptional regulator [Streptomyces actuosus]AWT42960.1 TetR family transcriptional regulator [Streptomyces actuosus]MBM4824913.1 TetR family transcriptional regulator [Streptomyces actuosus]